MGDPMNGRPATVIYGGTVANPDPNDGVVYAVTNEGYLQAIDAADGHELWAFMPKQLLARARNLFNNEAITDRTYGLDGNIRVVKNEVNENGVIEPGLGENVRIYFGMRRGGRDYFGLDVTNRTAPTLLFRIGPNEAARSSCPARARAGRLPPLRASISAEPRKTRSNRCWCSAAVTTRSGQRRLCVDASGNEIFMVDAVSGNVLWHAGPRRTCPPTAAGLDDHGILADVRIFDLTGVRPHRAPRRGRHGRARVALRHP